MGASESTPVQPSPTRIYHSYTPPSPPPPPPPEYDTPWRKMPWGKKDALEEKLRNFKLNTTDVKFVRILIVGEVGAGKSSFINTINDAFQERITSGALAGTCGTSFTKKYQTHHIKGKDGSRLPFVFNDIMGLEREGGKGICVDDIISALKGLIEEGYNFNPLHPASGKDSKNNPRVSDQTFCLVNGMQGCSNVLGIPMSHIFPVKNYHKETDTSDDMDVLILKALDQIVNLANDQLENQTSCEKWE
ncbi:interferon-induced protein 44-like [Tachysurus vachellii]|uniref:interferon-induced protein 44-like n=1 Tax=Tachysurus vachellii TaxID=175792 RepID=UPI00296AB18A|nr:interferon-induced protein 44-like [Tachysurus vachellii]